MTEVSAIQLCALGRVGFALLLLLSSCSGAVPVDGAAPASPSMQTSPGVGANSVPSDPCVTPEQSFAWELYGGVFSRCIGCHNDFGLARQVGVRLKLSFPGEPEFASKNVRVLSEYAQVRVDVNGAAVPTLLAKPTGAIAHVGGEVITAGSLEATLLEGFVAKLASPPSCRETPSDAAEIALTGLSLATPRQTLARAQFILTGELASPEALDELPDTDAMLDEHLDRLMQGERFLTRVQEMFADWLLTDAYSSIVRGNDLFPQLRDYPQSSYYQPLCTPERNFRCCDPATEACCVNVASDEAACGEQANDLAIDAVAREPLELVRYIVRNDLPMTELVTANYGMANPYSATVYGVTDAQRSAMFDADATNDSGGAARSRTAVPSCLS